MKKEIRSLDKLETKSKILVLVDSNAIIHRAYHALPKSLSNKKGEPTNAVYGFTTTLIKVLEDLHPDYLAASFDISKATFRVEQYAEYKAQRVAADQELYDQIPKVREVLQSFNIPIYEKEGYEADDCIGTITEKMARERKKGELEVYIVTGDKDLFQLIDGNIFVYNLRKGLSDTGIYDRKRIKEEYNLDPHDFIDLKALAGDTSDNIPGVPGIGSKTATMLLQKFDTLEKIYEQIETVIPAKAGIQALDPRVPFDSAQGLSEIEGKPEDDEIIRAAKSLDIKPRILNLLIEYKEQAFLSQKLATIHKEVPIEFDLEACKWGEYDKNKVRQLFEELRFISLLKRFGAVEAVPAKTKKAQEQKEKDEQLKLL